MSYDLNELRKKFNHGTIEEQKKISRDFLRKMNPGIKVFSNFPPVDQLDEVEENYLRTGIQEANKLRKEGKLDEYQA